MKLYVRKGVKFMPYFRKTEISDSELCDQGTYLARNFKHEDTIGAQPTASATGLRKQRPQETSWLERGE